MATNPLVAQGLLNRLRGSMTVTDLPELNVTAPYLGKQGMSMAVDGKATTYIPTLTGAVRSPEPYMMVTITLNLLKTQSLADQYKQRMETDSNLGDITITPDSSTLGKYPIVNCSISSVSPLAFNGEDAGMVITIEGYYQVNNSMWSLV